MEGRADPDEAWEVSARLDDGIAVSPDRTAVRVYPGGWWKESFTPYLVDLSSGEQTPLRTAEKEWFSFGGRLPELAAGRESHIHLPHSPLCTRDGSIRVVCQND